MGLSSGRKLATGSDILATPASSLIALACSSLLSGSSWLVGVELVEGIPPNKSFKSMPAVLPDVATGPTLPLPVAPDVVAEGFSFF